MDALAGWWGLESGHLCREVFWLGALRVQPIGAVGRRIGFALLGDSLFSVAKKVSKNACPSIRPRLRWSSLAPVTLQGPAAKGHPWPIAALAASMPLNPFHATCARPPERGDSVVPESSCNEVDVRASRDRRVGNAKLTHRYSKANFYTADCGGKCFAVFHPTEPACGQSCFSIARTARRRQTPLSEGRMESAWRGASGMDAARGVKGHGWPLYAGPRSVDGMREVERSETRMQGQDFLVPFGGPAIRATAKRDSPSRAKPLPQPTTTKSHYTRGQSRYRLAATYSGCITFLVPQC